MATYPGDIFTSTSLGYQVTLGFYLADWSPSATCFGPTFSGNLSTTSGTPIVTAGWNANCSPPEASVTDNTYPGTTAVYTSVLPYYSGTCPPLYGTAHATRLIFGGRVTTAAVCCPSGSLTSFSQTSSALEFQDLIYGAANPGRCIRQQNGPAIVTSGSITQTLSNSAAFLVAEQPIIVYSTSTVPLPSGGLTFTSVSVSLSDNLPYHTYTNLVVVPSTTSGFSVPTECLLPTIAVGINGYDFALPSYTDDQGIALRLAPSCYPNGNDAGGNVFSDPHNYPTVISYAQFYYPGTCPPGFDVVSSTGWTSSGSGSYTAFQGGWCCPQSYHPLGTLIPPLCTSAVTNPISVVDSPSTVTLDISQIGNMAYRAIGVASTSQVIGFGAVPGQTSSMPERTGASSDHSGDLSSGAAAGVGVGVGVLVLISCFAAFLLWRRWRSKRLTGKHEVEDGSEDSEKGRNGNVMRKSELPGDGSTVVEAPSECVSPEMDNMNFRAELEGDDPYLEAPGDRPATRNKPVEDQARG